MAVFRAPARHRAAVRRNLRGQCCIARRDTAITQATFQRDELNLINGKGRHRMSLLVEILTIVVKISTNLHF